ncbi:hypothetical protein CTheo_6976 [Ceratobasidium theobromae]|uniref:Uncharacterized protein n=1 Tax=Ceratobasidium theobromae TaxID=1582974 RepID=A0A5N5QDR3_9AGAM|nr:hypothetical protein CTheo_6976 [Ceratobasidium theobromae]
MSDYDDMPSSEGPGSDDNYTPEESMENLTSGQLITEALSHRLQMFHPHLYLAPTTKPVIPNQLPMPDPKVDKVPTTLGLSNINDGPSHMATVDRSKPTLQSEDTSVHLVAMPPQATQLFTVHYEKNSHLASQPTIFATLAVQSDIKPLVLRSLIVEKMGVFPMTAKLAYSIVPVNSQRSQKHKLQAFDSDEDVSVAINELLAANARKRTIERVLQVTNAVPALKTDVGGNAFTQTSALPTQCPSKNKKSSDVLIETTREHELVEDIKGRYYCARCPGNCCIIDPETSKHIRCDHAMISLWARQIVMRPGHVTLDHPPNHQSFDVEKYGKYPGRVSHAKSGSKSHHTVPTPGLNKILHTSASTSNTKLEAIYVPDSSSDTELSIYSIRSSSSDREFEAAKIEPNMGPKYKPVKIESDEVKAGAKNSESTGTGTTLPSPCNIGRPCTEALLCSLHHIFPELNLPSYADGFRAVGLSYAHHIADHTHEWISSHVSVPKQAALVILAAAWASNHKLGD